MQIRVFRCGAMAAHSTVNRVVTGSSPVTGAKNKKGCIPLKGNSPFYFHYKYTNGWPTTIQSLHSSAEHILRHLFGHINQRLRSYFQDKVLQCLVNSPGKNHDTDFMGSEFQVSLWFE